MTLPMERGIERDMCVFGAAERRSQSEKWKNRGEETWKIDLRGRRKTRKKCQSNMGVSSNLNVH